MMRKNQWDEEFHECEQIHRVVYHGNGESREGSMEFGAAFCVGKSEQNHCRFNVAEFWFDVNLDEQNKVVFVRVSSFICI